MRVQRLKIIVAGRINSGKRTFVRSIAQWQGPVSTIGHFRPLFRLDPRSHSVPENGQIEVDDTLTIHLLSVLSHLPSISIIPKKMQGYVVLVDSTDARSFYEARALLLYMFHFPRVPYIVVVNKQDLKGALTVEQIRHKMRLPAHVPMMGCIAMERDSVRNVLLELLYMIRPDLQKKIES